MLAIFCAHPLAPREPDPDFAAEAAAAREANLTIALLDFEALTADNPTLAIRRISAQPEPTLAVYRGWMLPAERYAALFEALATKNIRLLNDPAAYKTCHEFTGFYPLIESRTARSVWIAKENFGESLDAVFALLKEAFGSQPVVVKDWVKSQKHYWREACFIPDASDRDTAGSVIRRFLERQGDDLRGGLVFREFLDLEDAGEASDNSAPPSLEYRLFYLDGKVIARAPHWDAANLDEPLPAPPPEGEFDALAATIPSRFFTLDAANLRDKNEWVVVEIGDAQVSELRDPAQMPSFFRELQRCAFLF